MPSVYAQHMIVQPLEHEVVLAFFEVVPPLVTEKLSEDQVKAIQEAGIVAECVARITVARDTFPAFAQAMKQAIEQYESKTDADDTRDPPKD